MAKGEAKEKIIRTTSSLLENQGYHGTGIAEIVKESGAPKGSVYFHFPGGKEEIASEAVRYTGDLTSARIRQGLGQIKGSPRAIRKLIEEIAFHVEASGYRAGGPLLIVASEMATQSRLLNDACRKAYDQMLGAFREKIQEDGIPPGAAAALSTTVTAAIEGGIVLSRTYHSVEPLKQIAKDIELLILQVLPSSDA